MPEVDSFPTLQNFFDEIHSDINIGFLGCCIMKTHSTLQLALQKLPLVDFGPDFLHILLKNPTYTSG